MGRMVAILMSTAVLAGCATGFTLTPKEKFSLEQRAISSAISLCQKFGHKEDTKEFTRCAELRYDEYMIRNR
jgi:hypothetical protein